MNKLELKKQQLINSLDVGSSQLDIVFELLKLEHKMILQTVNISLTEQEVKTLQNAINYLLLGNNSTPDERKVLNKIMEKMK